LSRKFRKFVSRFFSIVKRKDQFQTDEGIVTDRRTHKKRRSDRKSEMAFPKIALFESLPCGIVLISPDETLTLNRMAEEITGYDRGELLSLDQWCTLLHGPQRERARAKYIENRNSLQLAKNSQSPLERVVPIIRKDGMVRHMEIVSTLGPDGIEIWALQDVTESVASQERLRYMFEEGRRIESRLSRAAEALVDAQKISKTGNFEIDYVNDRVEWSSQAAINFGLPDHVMMATIDWLAYVDPEDVERVSYEWREAQKGERHFDCEFRIVRGDGQMGVLHARANPVIDKEGMPIRMRGTFQDITDKWKQSDLLRHRESKLLRSARSVAVAQISGEMTEEIDHLVTMVSVDIDRSLQSIEEAGVFNHNVTNSMRPEVLNELQLALQRQFQKLKKTMRHMGGFSKMLRDVVRDSSADPFVPHSLDQIISQTLDLCSRRFKIHRIELKSPDIQEQGRLLECRPSEISQVILGLLNNAFDAVRDRDQAVVGIDVIDRESAWEIVISDNGPGLCSESVARLFEPFYTGKPEAGKVGLGLHTARSIVQNHGGWIRLEPANGARFVVRLPKKQNVIELLKVS
jgi:PAS domain S-box-containing protein